MKSLKPKLIPDCYELFARARVVDAEGVERSGDFLGYVEMELRGRKPWVLYTVTYGNGDSLGAFKGVAKAAAELAKEEGLKPRNINSRPARYSVMVGRKVIGSIELNHSKEWTWMHYEDHDDDSDIGIGPEYFSRSGALKKLLQAHQRELARKASRRATERAS